jgi:hypothetical protein
MHDCKPPAKDLDFQGRLAGTKWQCDHCWQIWSLDMSTEGKYWRRDGNPHCAVVANADGDLIQVPSHATFLPNPHPTTTQDDFDARRVAFWLILAVVLAALLTFATFWLDGRIR